MISYDAIVRTISELYNNELVYKEGLSLVYELDPKIHYKLNEDFYYRLKPEGIDDFEATDEFEVELGGIRVIFRKNEEE